MDRHAGQLRAAQAAWTTALEPARLPRTDPARVPYPEAVKRALEAWDKEMGNVKH